jgi:hypothetical protein
MDSARALVVVKILNDSGSANHLSLAGFGIRTKDGLIGAGGDVPVGWQLEFLWQPAKLKSFGDALLI